MLLGNGVRDNRNPLTLRGVTAPAGERSQAYATGPRLNFPAGSANVPDVSLKAGVPSAYRSGVAWILPFKSGAVSSRQDAQGFATVQAKAALGRYMVVLSEGVAVATASGGLITRGAGLSEGTAVATAGLSGLLTGAGLSEGTAVATANAVNAAGSMVCLSEGTAVATARTMGRGFAPCLAEGFAVATAAPFAYGFTRGLSDVGAADVLSPESIANELLDIQLIETGYTLRETLRICGAVLSGRVSGGAGPVVSIQAMGGGKVRVLSTVDSSGNRTAVTLDTSD